MERKWNMRLIKKGAEANLYLSELNGKAILVKRRVKKRYRLKELDKRIRLYRTIHEAQLIHDAKKAGVPTPIIYTVDVYAFTIIMEFIVGERLKELFYKASREDRGKYSRLIGVQVASLHTQNIIHGDLTTSNMIKTYDGKLYFIDFGLGFYSTSIEDKGVDLHLLKRALNSTHHRIADECFREALEGYRSILGDETDGTTRKIREIERRGRYFAERR
jgi:TP53 regulating kinase-like protein